MPYLHPRKRRKKLICDGANGNLDYVRVFPSGRNLNSSQSNANIMQDMGYCCMFAP